jgi:hypothetical protein
VVLAHSVAARLEVSDEYQPSQDRTRDWKSAGGDWAFVYLQDPLALKPIPVRSLSGEEIQRISASKSATQVGYGPDRQYMPSIIHNCEIRETALSAVLSHRCFMDMEARRSSPTLTVSPRSSP